jgi:transposase
VHETRCEALTDSRRCRVASAQAGHTPDEVVDILGVSRAAAFSWLSMCRAGGWDALTARKRGGRPRKLTGKQGGVRRVIPNQAKSNLPMVNIINVYGNYHLII